MNIVVIVAKAYYGVTPAGGAETYLHDTLKFLVSQGHDITVFLSGPEHKTDIVDGVVLKSHMNRDLLEQAVIDCDLVMTHLDGTPLAQSFAQRLDKPLVQIVHNTNEYTEGFLAYGVDLAVYNADWVSEYHETLKKGPMTKYWVEKQKSVLMLRRQTSWDSFILKPWVQYEQYKLPADPARVNGYITLVNPNENKGAHIFYELARRCPDLEFLAVVGGYAPKEQKFVDLPNVTKHEHVQDMRQVYNKSSMVLMPSTYESYGRVAVEAACAGVPSVVSSTPGLCEAMGDAAGFVTPVQANDYSTIDDWEKAIRYVLTDYKFCVDAALQRGRQLSTEGYANLHRFESRLEDLVETWGS